MAEFDVDKRLAEIQTENEKLKKRIEEYEMFMSNIPINVFMKDTSSIYRIVSAESARRNNTTVEYMIGKSDYDFVEASLYAEKHINTDRLIVENRIETNYLDPYLEDGTVKYMSICKKPCINKEGVVGGVFGIVTYSVPGMEQNIRDMLPGDRDISDFSNIIFDYSYVSGKVKLLGWTEDFSYVDTLFNNDDNDSANVAWLKDSGYVNVRDYSKIIKCFRALEGTENEFKFVFRLRDVTGKWRNCIFFSKAIGTDNNEDRHAVGLILALEEDNWTNNILEWVREEEYSDILVALTDAYEAVYMVDAEEETIETLKRTSSMNVRWFGIENYNAGMELLLTNMPWEVADKFRDRFSINNIKKLIYSDKSRSYVEMKTKKSGVTKWYGITMMTIKSNRVVVMVQDISERIINDRRSRHLSSVIGLVFKDYFDYLYEINIDDNKFYMLENSDDCFERKRLNSFDDIVARLQSRCYPEDMDILTEFFSYDELRELNAENNEKSLEIRNIDGKWYTMTFHYSVVEDKNEIFIIIKNNDVMKRKELEDMRKLSDAVEEAEKSNHAKSVFLANMSHEIRTPLNGIIGMNEMIIRETKEEETRKSASVVLSSGKILLALINDILDFSKIESGKMDIVDVDYSMSKVINNITSMIKVRAEDKGLAFELKIEDGLPDKLYGDDIRLKQIITNILTNAVKYTQKGKVTLYVGYKLIDDYHIELVISVTDTGIGIKQENMESLFRSFERLDMLHNRSIEGTGLGMTITSRLLDMMNGMISVESEYGKGSTFQIIVPQIVRDINSRVDFNESEDVNVQKIIDDKTVFDGAEILVVDDNKINLMVAEKMLKNLGCKVDCALSGMAGIRKACDKTYDIIFLDHLMPELDGVEILHMLNENPDNSNTDTPVIIMTANAISGVKDYYIGEGFTDYVPKPIDREHLKKVISKYLKKE
ncbi:MAG: response regulator [Lachnospiraceae bacterium]|nr:response regulator [Lachnospiraceae bacterium]